jgi:hypothetical protein
MENTFWTALGASSLAAAVTTIGIYVIRRFERWGRNNTIYFICFAAGVLISVSFLHIIPKAFSMNAKASFYLFAVSARQWNSSRTSGPWQSSNGSLPFLICRTRGHCDLCSWRAAKYAGIFE